MERETPRPTPTTGFSGHIILCGLDKLGFRTLEELRRLGEEVVVIARGADEAFRDDARTLGAILIEGSHREESAWRAAGVANACATVIAEDDDVGNLHAALTAQELSPNLRIVLRIFNQDFGRQIEALFRDCSVLSASAIAAPAFVSAALHQDWEQRIVAAGRVLILQQASTRDAGVVLPLAHVQDNGPTVLFPPSGDDLLCLTDGGPAPTYDDRDSGNAAKSRKRRRPSPSEVFAALWSAMVTDGLRLGYLLAFLAVVTLSGIVIFQAFANLDLVDAIYFTVTVITTTGFGDINLRDAPPALKLYGAALMLLGTAALAIFYAFMTDAIVGVRLTHALGGLHRGMRDHIVVCGLGTIGYRVVEQIAEMGLPVTAAELQETGRFLPAVRRLGIPTLIGDARLVETLQALNVADARCLIAATDDDLANLETALNARALNPNLRVVLRLFDPDLALRVERAFGVHISRSVSALAAPAFAAAAVGQRIIATLPVGPSVLVMAQTRVEAGSQAEGDTVSTLGDPAESRVLVLTDGDEATWSPPPETRLAAGQEVTIVATRRGLAQVLANTAVDGPSG